MTYIFKLHALTALLSLLVVWARGALSFQGRDDLASGKPALIASAVTMGLLLFSALVLVVFSGQYPFSHDWVTEKLIWLFSYVALAVISLMPKLPDGLRLVIFGAANMAFAFAYATAKHHVGIFLQ